MPSEVQLETLRRMAASPDKAIHRWPGGFWTTSDTPGLPLFRGTKEERGRNDVPEWYVSIQTIRAMERQGLIIRNYTYHEEWKDTRTVNA